MGEVNVMARNKQTDSSDKRHKNGSSETSDRGCLESSV